MNIDEVMDKIRKAVRLANRTSESGERDTALRLAKGLAEKNGIAFDDISVDGEDTGRAVQETEEDYHSFSGSEVGHICNILQRHFGVILMLYQIRGKKWKCRKSWFGSHLNIELAKHICHILLRESRRAYREESRPVVDDRADKLAKQMMEWGATQSDIFKAVANLKPRKVNRQAFMAGFFYAIDRTLEAHPIRNDIDEARRKAERKLEEFKANNKTKDARHRTAPADAAAITAGLNSGRAVNLSRPCEGSDNSPLALTA